jgi:hypothetical protein
MPFIGVANLLNDKPLEAGPRAGRSPTDPTFQTHSVIVPARLRDRYAHSLRNPCANAPGYAESRADFAHRSAATALLDIDRK